MVTLISFAPHALSVPISEFWVHRLLVMRKMLAFYYQRARLLSSKLLWKVSKLPLSLVWSQTFTPHACFFLDLGGLFINAHVAVRKLIEFKLVV